jgi:RNA:NAD 2'-phosphotransferase (TPT1/KptA family)
VNEQIKLLAHQAWVNNDQLDTGGYTDLEKFAHLIVREVFSVIENERYEIYDLVVHKVKQHFGVKS